MAVVCILMVFTGFVSLILCLKERDSFQVFMVMTKLVTAIAMFLSFHAFKWDAAKGLLGGVLFSLMYQDAYLALDKLWKVENFDAYLITGVQGSIFLAGAVMNLLMTVVITLNHFFINYSAKGTPKNVILNRIAMLFKFATYILLVAANSQLDFSTDLRITQSMQYLMDIALFVLVACMEAQFDSFNIMRQELRESKRGRKKGK